MLVDLCSAHRNTQAHAQGTGTRNASSGDFWVRRNVCARVYVCLRATATTKDDRICAATIRSFHILQLNVWNNETEDGPKQKYVATIITTVIITAAINWLAALRESVIIFIYLFIYWPLQNRKENKNKYCYFRLRCRCFSAAMEINFIFIFAVNSKLEIENWWRLSPLQPSWIKTTIFLRSNAPGTKSASAPMANGSVAFFLLFQFQVLSVVV